MQLEVKEPEREPWEIHELRTLFNSEVFAAGVRPDGGRGEAAYWLPLLGIFTGARLGELASLAVHAIVTDERTDVVYLSIFDDEDRGRKLKTASSRRVVPVHPQLVKLGFLSLLVEQRRTQDGGRALLFPLIEPGSGGQYGASWSKWFGRYIRNIGIENRARVFHSLRHGFKDELRIAGVSEDLHECAHRTALAGRTEPRT
jgi:integrase